MAAKTSRADLERQLAALARFSGWRHHRAGVGSGSPSGEPDGFPTETLLRDQRLLFAFLTGRQRRLTPLEQGWLDALTQVRAVEVHVFDPVELAELTRVLRGHGPTRQQPGGTRGR